MNLRARIYDRLIVPMTSGWYRHVLDHLPEHAQLLDVGIGTGSALLVHAATLRQRHLRVTGVDIDAAYVVRCREAIARTGLEDRVEARLESVYDHRGGPYDAVYFSASFMLLPDPPAALRHILPQLAADGRVFFTQTFERRRSPLVERIKPLLKLVTTIDFGQVTYEPGFRAALAAGGLRIEEWRVLHESRRRAAVLVAAVRDV